MFQNLVENAGSVFIEHQHQMLFNEKLFFSNNQWEKNEKSLNIICYLCSMEIEHHLLPISMKIELQRFLIDVI